MPDHSQPISSATDRMLAGRYPVPDLRVIGVEIVRRAQVAAALHRAEVARQMMLPAGVARLHAVSRALDARSTPEAQS